MKLQHIRAPVKVTSTDKWLYLDDANEEVVTSFPTAVRDDAKRVAQYNDLALAVNFFDRATYVLLAWQTLAEESLDFRLALTNLGDGIGAELLEMTQDVLGQAGVAPYCEEEPCSGD